MSKCCKCGKEPPENTQGTVCQKCFWCSYTLNENKTKERKMSKNKVKVECENCVFYDQQIQQKDTRIAELEKQLAIRDKAIEFACIKIEDLRCENADIADYEYNEIKTETRKKLLFEQAEKEIKGEK